MHDCLFSKASGGGSCNFTLSNLVPPNLNLPIWFVCLCCFTAHTACNPSLSRPMGKEGNKDVVPWIPTDQETSDGHLAAYTVPYSATGNAALLVRASNDGQNKYFIVHYSYCHRVCQNSSVLRLFRWPFVLKGAYVFLALQHAFSWEICRLNKSLKRKNTYVNYWMKCIFVRVQPDTKL